MTSKRVALYARVSTLNHGQDPEVQLHELRAYCERRGFEIICEYVDKGVSGSRERRPALDKLLTDCRRRLVDAVVVYRYDRFARSLRQLANALEEFRSLGIDFVSIHEGVDTSTPNGRLIFGIFASIAEFERELIRDRVRSGLAVAKAKGPKQELERDFTNLLAVLQPTLEYLNRLPEIAAKQWQVRKEGIAQESRALNIRLTEQKRLNSEAIKAKLKGELSQEDFDSIKAEIAEDINNIESELKTRESERKTLQEMTEQVKLDNVSFVKAWQNSEIQGKHELQKALFPDGLVWSHEMGFLNQQNKWLIDDLMPIFQEFARTPMTVEQFFVRFGVPDGI